MGKSHQKDEKDSIDEEFLSNITDDDFDIGTLVYVDLLERISTSDSVSATVKLQAANLIERLADRSEVAREHIEKKHTKISIKVILASLLQLWKPDA